MTDTDYIRGRVVFDRGDGAFTFARMVRGHERKVRRVEVDGTCYYPDDFEFVEHYEDGRCVAVELDGVRYAREAV